MVQANYQKDLYIAVAKVLRKNNLDYFSATGMTLKELRGNVSKRATMCRAYSAGAHSIAKNMFADMFKGNFADKYGITTRDALSLSYQSIKAIDEVCPSNAILKVYLQKIVGHLLGEFEWQDGNGVKINHIRAANKKRIGALWQSLWDKRREVKKEESDEVDLSIQNAITALYAENDEMVRVLIRGQALKEITWTTPSGFIVITRHMLQCDHKSRVTLGKHRINFNCKIDTGNPDLQKHISCVAANLIHSNDSAHMALTIEDLDAVHFAGVHDSFAVHACAVEDLVASTKKTFIKMYDVDNYYSIIDESFNIDSSFPVAHPVLGNYDIAQSLPLAQFFFA